MVSVIVPVYNLENHINYCIESVLRQTHSDFELILVDDGSTDNTYAICKEASVKDSRVKVIRQDNQGVSAARNTGIRHAAGEHIMFIDGDDVISPCCIEHLLNYFDEDTAAVIGEITRIRTYEYSFEEKEHFERSYTGEECLKLLIEGRFPISACAALFRRECIGKIRFPEKIKHNEDKYFLFRFLLENENMKVMRTSEQVYGYYVRETSATKSKWNGSTDVVKVADRIYSVIKERKPELTEAARNAALSARLLQIRNIVLAEDGNNHTDLYNKYREEVLKNGFPKNAGKRTKVMYIALRLGKPVFWVMVRTYYKAFNENRRFEFNEKLTSI